MKKDLEELGWTQYYECTVCSGGLRQYYSNPNFPAYVVRTRESKGTFVILQNNIIVTGPHWSYQVKEKIKEHVH